MCWNIENWQCHLSGGSSFQKVFTMLTVVTALFLNEYRNTGSNIMGSQVYSEDSTKMKRTGPGQVEMTGGCSDHSSLPFTHSHTHSYIASMGRTFSTRGTSGFSILPKDTSSGRCGRLGSTCRPSGYLTTTLIYLWVYLFMRKRVSFFQVLQLDGWMDYNNFPVDIWTCHSRKSTGVTVNMNNGSVQFTCPSKTLNLQPLNGTQPWVILLFIPVTCESASCVKKVCTVPTWRKHRRSRRRRGTVALLETLEQKSCVVLWRELIKTKRWALISSLSTSLCRAERSFRPWDWSQQSLNVIQ